MTDMDRKYTEEEFALILRKASEIQDGPRSTEDGGMSLDEIRAIAREVGIDPTAVDRAAALVPRAATDLGAPVRFRLRS